MRFVRVGQVGFDLDTNKGIKTAQLEKCMDRFSEKRLLSLHVYAKHRVHAFADDLVVFS